VARGEILHQFDSYNNSTKIKSINLHTQKKKNQKNDDANIYEYIRYYKIIYVRIFNIIYFWRMSM